MHSNSLFALSGALFLLLTGCSGTQPATPSVSESASSAPAPVASAADPAPPQATNAPAPPQATNAPAPPQATNAPEAPGQTAGGEQGAPCGTRGRGPCPDGQFCSYPISARCGHFDLAGRCTVKPETCTRIHAPVCGCDRKTYESSCVAASQGQSVASEGKCPSK